MLCSQCRIFKKRVGLKWALILTVSALSQFSAEKKKKKKKKRKLYGYLVCIVKLPLITAPSFHDRP